jgi:hypothetical protein
MKFAIVLLLAVPALGQKTAPYVVRPPVAAACGSPDVEFDVKQDKTGVEPVQVQAGKALVYFIQDTGIIHRVFWQGAGVVSRIGMDGAWVGADKGDSYFAIPVEPGEHHLCVSPQGGLEKVEVSHFTAEAGKIYYFRTRILGGVGDGSGFVLLQIEPVDSDEAKFLIASDPVGVARPRKVMRGVGPL